MAITRILGANAITGVIPVANGGTGATSFSPGKTLQVVSAIRATEISTSSTDYVTTNCTASITPSATSSKVLVMIAGAGRQNNDGGTAKYTVYRDSTALGSNTANGFSEISVTGGTYPKGAYAITFLDSPSSTSAVAYTLYMKNQTGSTGCRACHNNTNTTVTLMEIAE
jgi:hypothetical protein|tara:strand:- start:940 stop:1446 length:507 start_codon:yes stop_codon:yes gene_type:complete